VFWSRKRRSADPSLTQGIRHGILDGGRVALAGAAGDLLADERAARLNR
jgi:hypothetical protein